MKRIALFVLLVALSGCMLPIVENPETGVSLLSEPGVIHEPLLNGMPFGYNRFVQPGQKLKVDWRTGVGQDGNPCGLSDDQQWRINEVTIILSERGAAEDTVFWPVECPENVALWFVGWTGPIDGVSGLPYLMEPASVQPILKPSYPWNSCAPHPIPAYPEQMAQIWVDAVARWVEVGLILDKLEGGREYLVEWPGIPAVTHWAGGSMKKRLDEPGTVFVTMPDHTVVEYDVPVDWFWCDAFFERAVGPSGPCG